MNFKALAASASVLAGASVPFTAAAQDQQNTGSVTALMLIRTVSSDGGVMAYEVKGLANLETCLTLAWTNSLESEETDHGNEIIVNCLQNGRIIGGQGCYKGACHPFGLLPGEFKQ